jgi:uncharacterized protein (TIGR01777 family)
MPPFIKRSPMPASAGRLFQWHAAPGAFARLTPPWERVELEEHEGIRDGACAIIRTSIGPFVIRWVAEHHDCIEDRQFCDRQIAGPFARWEHVHRFEPLDAGRSALEDRVEYELPLGAAGRALGAAGVRRKLERLFAYRHRITADDLAAHDRFAARGSMKILVSGSTGLIGSALVPFLTAGGHAVVALARTGARRAASHPAQAVEWNPDAGIINRAALEGFDAVVHLAGENIAGRWTAAKKERIRASRTGPTRLISEALAQLTRPPKVLVCASAVGIYGDRGDEILVEASAPGSGFLAEVGREWEAAAEPARVAGIRVVHLRFGIVLSPRGGALARMLPAFRLGLGGRVGSGRQFWSWIALDDAVGAIHHTLFTDSLSGPVNAVAPQAVTNGEFTRTLARVLGRPALLPAPACALRLALGEMAEAALLASTRAEPRRLAETGYAFRFPQLEPALRHLLGRDASGPPA